MVKNVFYFSFNAYSVHEYCRLKCKISILNYEVYYDGKTSSKLARKNNRKQANYHTDSMDPTAPSASYLSHFSHIVIIVHDEMRGRRQNNNNLERKTG